MTAILQRIALGKVPKLPFWPSLQSRALRDSAPQEWSALNRLNSTAPHRGHFVSGQERRCWPDLVIASHRLDAWVPATASTPA